jgi:hypothetical protein
LNDLNWVDLFPEWDEGVKKLIGFFRPELLFKGANSSPKTKLISSADLRFDGLYQSQLLAKKHFNYWNYLRFYPDGVVINVSSTGKPAEIVKWFDKFAAVKSNYKFGQGKFVFEKNHVRFSASSSTGVVDYEGEVFEKRLILKSHSHINDNRGMYEYVFSGILK